MSVLTEKELDYVFEWAERHSDIYNVDQPDFLSDRLADLYMAVCGAITDAEETEYQDRLIKIRDSIAVEILTDKLEFTFGDFDEVG